MVGLRFLHTQLKEVTFWLCNAVADHVNDMQYDVTLLTFPPTDPDPIVNDSRSSCIICVCARACVCVCVCVCVHESLETEFPTEIERHGKD